MPSPFDAARLSLQAACLSATGNLKVTYTRGNSSIANLPAVPGKSQLASDSMTPGRLAFETHDFMIQTSLLAVGGVSWFPPLEGDRIASGGNVFEVVSPAYRGSDNATVPVVVRIHTKLAS